MGVPLQDRAEGSKSHGYTNSNLKNNIDMQTKECAWLNMSVIQWMYHA